MELVQKIGRDKQQGSEVGRSLGRFLPHVLGLAIALSLGAALPFVTTLPRAWAVLICLAICGLFAVVVLTSINIELTPILRFILLLSFWFHLEINLFPILKNHADPPGLNISLMLIVSSLLAAAYVLKRWQSSEREPVIPSSFKLTLIGAWLWCALTVAYGAEGMLGIYGLWSMAASILMCFVVVAQFGDRRSLQHTLVTVAALIACIGALGIAQSLMPSLSQITIGESVEEDPVIIGGEEATRIHALSRPSNMFAWVLVLFLPMVIAQLLRPVASLRRWQRALCAFAAALAVVVLILTYSRGSWIAFGLSIPLMALAALLTLKAEERRRLILNFSAVAVVLGLLAIPFSEKIVSRLTDDDRGSAEVRLPLIEVALAMIAANPIVGVGVGSYESVMRSYDETSDFVTEHFDWPVHNVYLHVAAETGIPGLLLLLLLAVIAFRRGWVVLRDPDADSLLRVMALGFLGGMVAYLITGLKEGSCFQTASMRPFYLICGLLIATDRANRRPAENSDLKLQISHPTSEGDRLIERS